MIIISDIYENYKEKISSLLMSFYVQSPQQYQNSLWNSFKHFKFLYIVQGIGTVICTTEGMMNFTDF